MLLVSRSFQVLRRRARVIRVFSAFLALLLTPVALILFAILFLGLGFPDASPGEILRDTWRWTLGFFVRLFSGHALRPFTLRSVSGARFCDAFARYPNQALRPTAAF